MNAISKIEIGSSLAVKITSFWINNLLIIGLVWFCLASFDYNNSAVFSAFGSVILVLVIKNLILFLNFFDLRPRLVITAQGIFLKNEKTSIDWATIRSSVIKRTPFEKVLLVNVLNSDSIISNSGGLNKIILWFRYIVYGTPILISGSTINCSIDDLHAIIDKCKKEYVRL